MKPCRGRRWSWLLLAALFALCGPGVQGAGAQQQQGTASDTIRACDVPGGGTMYRVGVPGLPATSNSKAHTEFEWNVMGPVGPAGPAGPAGPPGPPGPSVHGQLQGLDADDHPQYLLLGGARNSNSGVAVTGTFSSSTPLPVSGPGVRLLWYPARAAFRAGWATGSE